MERKFLAEARLFSFSILNNMSLTPPLLPLYESLKANKAQARWRFHVPGHAGLGVFANGAEGLPAPIYAFDQTEVDGLDVLSQPTGCLAEAQANTAARHRVAHSFFLVNGATVGILAGMLAALRPGSRVLIARNVHRAVISGLILTGARPVWGLPSWNAAFGVWEGIRAQQVAAWLENASQEDDAPIAAVILTSPTYEGWGSEIAEIAVVCRQYGALLLVDEAHGNLWSFSEKLPMSACEAGVPHGADLVIQSSHKSLGSLTQTALAHLPYGARLNPQRFQEALNTVQTTSPSYLLMASLEAAQAYLASEAGQARLASHLAEVNEVRKRISRLQHFALLCPPPAQGDPCRVVLRHLGKPGAAQHWADALEGSAGLAYEATTSEAVLYIMNIGLDKSALAHFWETLAREDARLQRRQGQAQLAPLFSPSLSSPLLPVVAMSPRSAFFAPGVPLPREACEGKIAQQTIVHCPPGIPTLLPGERIQAAQLAALPPTVWVVEDSLAIPS
jgi:arginine/lysine/ornithine decarboxylase